MTNIKRRIVLPYCPLTLSITANGQGDPPVWMVSGQGLGQIICCIRHSEHQHHAGRFLCSGDCQRCGT